MVWSTRRYLLNILYHRIIFWLHFPANEQTAFYYVTFSALPFFSLYLWKVRRTIFSLLGCVISTLFWVGWIFYIISLIDNSINSNNQTIRYQVLHKLSPALRVWLESLPNHMRERHFQKCTQKMIIIWWDQLNCYKMDDGFIPIDQNIERTSRRTKMLMQFLTATRYFGIYIFMPFLLVTVDFTHPVYENRSSIGLMGCSQLILAQNGAFPKMKI